MESELVDLLNEATSLEQNLYCSTPQTYDESLNVSTSNQAMARGQVLRAPLDAPGTDLHSYREPSRSDEIDADRVVEVHAQIDKVVFIRDSIAHMCMRS